MQVLDLPKSRIALHRDEMVKYGPGDTAIARYPTDQIVSVELEKTRELGGAGVIIAIFASLAFVAHRYVTSPGWAWTAVIACLGICAFAVLGIEGRRLVIETSGGTARYPVADLFEEAEGFVVSANTLLALGAEQGSETEVEDKELVAADS